MKKIIIASTNPVKINAVAAAFGKMFPGEAFETEGISAASGVSNQPKSDSETFEGAMNRAENASHMADGDFWVGIEGGVEEMVRPGSPQEDSQMEAFAWVVIKGKDGKFGKGRTGTFFLPPKVAELIKRGMELGEADDIVFKRKSSKQENGAVGILTGNIMDRTRYYTETVVLALVPFKNEELYPQ